jgi:hypothetical protein
MLTSAEILLELAAALGPRSKITLVEDCGTSADRFFALARVSLDFVRQPKSVQLRALVEEWDALRIRRELY